MAWQLEAWELPGTGTGAKILFQIPAIEAYGKRTLSAVGSGRFTLPIDEDLPFIDDIVDPASRVSRLIRIVNDGTEVVPFFSEKAQQDLDEDGLATIKVSGPGIEKILEWGAIHPWDKDEVPLTVNDDILFPHWIWAGTEMLQNPGFEDGREETDSDPDSPTFGEGTGTFKATGWEPSPHGALATSGFELNTFEALSGTYALKVNPLDLAAEGRYSGAQQVVNVQAGGIYQAQVTVKTNETTLYDWRLVARDIDENLLSTDSIDDWDEQSINNASGQVIFSLANIRIPRNVDQMILRFAVVSATGNPGPMYLDNATMREGFVAASPGVILTALIAAIKARGVLTFLDTSSWTDTLDSAGHPWTSDALSFTANAGETLLQILAKFAGLGYEWTITGDVEAGYALEVYNGAGAGSTIPNERHLKAGIDILSSTIMKGIPTKNAVLVVGEGGVWRTGSNGADQTAYGEREKVVLDNDIADSTSALARADTELNLHDFHRFGIKVKVLDNDSNRPFAATNGIELGDKMGIDLTPIAPNSLYRIHSIAGTFRDEVPEWDYDLNRPVWTERESMVELVRRTHQLATAVARRAKEPKSFSRTTKAGVAGASASSSSVPGTTIDTDPPSQPKAPTLTPSFGAIRVSHALGIQGGSDYTLETDIRYLRVYASTTTPLTFVDSNLVDTIPIRRTNFTTDIPVAGTFTVGTEDLGPWYVAVTAVDASGNESTGSPEANTTALLAVPDATFRIADQADATKLLAFELSGLTTATTRTLAVQDVNGTIEITAHTIHDDVAGEINAIATKASPVAGDMALIEDSADSFNKKKVDITAFLGGGGGTTFADDVFQVYDNVDNSKILAFQVSGVTAATTRTLTIPDASGTIELEGHTHLESDVTDLAHYDDTATDARIAIHAAIVDAHHTRYTDAEAAAKVAADDLYVQVAGDTMGGALNMGNQTLLAPLDPTLGTHVGDRDYNDLRYAALAHASTHSDGGADEIEVSDLAAAGVTGFILERDGAGGLQWIATPTGGTASPLTTKGDIWIYTTTDARLGVGADDSVLVADSGPVAGLSWKNILDLAGINIGATGMTLVNEAEIHLLGTAGADSFFIENNGANQLLIRDWDGTSAPIRVQISHSDAVTNPGDMVLFAVNGTTEIVRWDESASLLIFGEEVRLDGNPWKTWSPTYSGSPGITVGNGTVTARYAQIGNIVIADYLLVLGSTSVVDAPAIVSLPVTAANVYDFGDNIVGGAWFADSDGTDSIGVTRLESTTTMRPIAQNASGTYVTINGLSTTIPFTWATGDTLQMRAIYEAA